MTKQLATSTLAVVIGLLLAVIATEIAQTAAGAPSYTPTRAAAGGWSGHEAAAQSTPQGELAPPAMGVRGTATWYCGQGSACTRGYPAPGGLYAAAGPVLRDMLGPGWRYDVVQVCAVATGSCVQVQLIDSCACRHGRRVLDLYAYAFRRLAPLSRGTLGVTVSTIELPAPPATDTAP